jgi:LDH2 family malate/lactate/ureidoglycolate dehydrogenase
MEKMSGVRLNERPLSTFVEALFRKAGASAAGARAVTRAAVDASSRGVDTHGVRLVPYYLKCVQGGRIDGKAKPVFRRLAPGVGHVDGRNGFGHCASYLAVERGMMLAKDAGIAAVAVGNSSHYGAAGCYALAAARAGYAAFSFTTSESVVVPQDGKRAYFGTNPIAFATPVPGAEPLVFDMATSSIPYNRVFLRRATGQALPPEVAVDKSGRMTVDPHAVAALLPLGGLAYGYKGAGLAAVVDILCSCFARGLPGAETVSTMTSDFSFPIPLGHFFIVMNPALFAPPAEYGRTIRSMLKGLRAVPAHRGRKVMAPGDPEIAEAARRRRRGIPLDRATWRALVAAADDLGVSVPRPRAR